MAIKRVVFLTSACLLCTIDGLKEPGNVQWKPMAELLVTLNPSLAFNMVPPSATRGLQRNRATDSSMIAMTKPKRILAAKGPLGGSKEYVLNSKGEYEAKEPEKGWLGDQSNSLLIKKFETGEEYLFFQNPTPKTGVQPDLPGFFSADNLGAIPGRVFQGAVKPQIFGTFAAGLVALLLIAGPLTESIFPDGIVFASKEVTSEAGGVAQATGEGFFDKLNRLSQEAAQKRAEDAKTADNQKLIESAKKDLASLETTSKKGLKRKM